MPLLNTWVLTTCASYFYKPQWACDKNTNETKLFGSYIALIFDNGQRIISSNKNQTASFNNVPLYHEKTFKKPSGIVLPLNTYSMFQNMYWLNRIVLLSFMPKKKLTNLIKLSVLKPILNKN